MWFLLVPCSAYEVVVIRQAHVVHRHGEVFDVGVDRVLEVYEFIAVIWRVGLKSHGDGLLLAVVAEGVVHVNVGIVVIADGYCQHLALHADVSLMYRLYV